MELIFCLKHVFCLTLKYLDGEGLATLSNVAIQLKRLGVSAHSTPEFLPSSCDKALKLIVGMKSLCFT